MNKQIEISDTLSIPRLVMGLWQIADMERNEQLLDSKQTARHMDSYISA